MKKAYVAEGALNLALACSAGTGDAEKAEPVAEVVALGQYEFPHLQWLSADHSFRVPCGTKLYTEQQLNELICQLSTAKSLSVTNIIINVVPGEDGMGEEVYAKSVAEVEREFSRLSQKLDAVEQQRDELVADAERYRWLRDRNNPLEKYDFNNQVDNGKSCYHVVGEVRELKHGDELDAAIDAAIAALAKVGAGNTQHPVSTD